MSSSGGIMSRLYVLVRKDLSKSQQAVQGGHAVAQFVMEHPDTAVNDWDGVLVYLGVNDVKELETWLGSVSRSEVPFSYFLDPDLDIPFTAFAAVSSGEEFKELKLL